MAPASRTWTGPDPNDLTAWTIVQAGHLVGRRFWQALIAVDLSPVQFGVLLNLDLHPGMSNAQLARSVLITPQSMSELMSALARAGLVERDASPGRGRPVTARLTAAGRTRLAACASIVGAVEASLDLTDAQARAVREHLRHTSYTGD